jgi:hypothetical protein
MVERAGKKFPQRYLNELRAFKEHQMCNEKQKACLKKKIDSLRGKRRVMIMDFKEDWGLALANEEIQDDFFTKNQVAHLGIVSIRRGIDGKLHYEYYHFLSNPSKKDGVMVGECLFLLKGIPEVKAATQLDFFCDCGAHFLNNCVIFHLLHPKGVLSEFRVTLTLFTEHHGKSICDSCFGYLARAVPKKMLRTVE